MDRRLEAGALAKGRRIPAGGEGEDGQGEDEDLDPEKRLAQKLDLMLS